VTRDDSKPPRRVDRSGRDLAPYPGTYDTSRTTPHVSDGSSSTPSALPRSSLCPRHSSGFVRRRSRTFQGRPRRVSVVHVEALSTSGRMSSSWPTLCSKDTRPRHRLIEMAARAELEVTAIGSQRGPTSTSRAHALLPGPRREHAVVCALRTVAETAHAHRLFRSNLFGDDRSVDAPEGGPLSTSAMRQGAVLFRAAAPPAELSGGDRRRAELLEPLKPPKRICSPSSRSGTLPARLQASSSESGVVRLRIADDEL